MTKLEWEMVQELAHCTFAPATFDKKFVRNMASRNKTFKLSEKQRGRVWQMHYRYRKQILHYRMLRTAKDG